ncbi:MAG: hypothetical protein ACK5KO_02675 [Arachnia sp.]
MSISTTLRTIGNLANGSTPLGLAVALLGGGRLRRESSLVVAERVRLPGITAGALTIGSVVLIPKLTAHELRRRVPTVMAHEDEHAWQWAYSLGLPFIPLYLGAMAWSWLRTGDRASANFFEVQAGLTSGGYRQRPVTPWRSRWRQLRGGTG